MCVRIRMFDDIKYFFNKMTYGPEAFIFTTKDNIRYAILQPRNLHFLNFNGQLLMYMGEKSDGRWKCIKFTKKDTTIANVLLNPNIIDEIILLNPVSKIVISNNFNSEKKVIDLINEALKKGIFTLY